MDVFMLAVLNLLALLWVAGVNGDVFVKDILTNNTIKKYSDLQASFGLDFPPNGLEGWLVYAGGDHKACRPVKPPPKNCTDFNCKFILLISRGGNCEFSDKVLNAEQHNYAAVIVHNYVHNEDVISMGGGVNGSLVHIPATFVGYSSGMELLGYNYTSRRYIIRIWEEDDDEANFPKFLWPFLLAMTVCILVALVFLYQATHIRSLLSPKRLHFSDSSLLTTVVKRTYAIQLLVKLLREQASKKLNRLSKKHLKKIPVRKFKKGDYYDTCAICLDEYEEGEKIRVLPCDHVYHMKCIDPWLTKNKKTCPVCKRRVIPHRDADSESESDADNAQGSENTPLLTGQTRGQSHGSVTESDVVLNPADSDSCTTGQDVNALVVAGDSALLQDSDIEHGAVGGEEISIRNPRQQTLLTIAKHGRGNIQEADEESDTNKERKKKQRDWIGSEEEEAISSSLLGADRREKRKMRKNKKKKAENRLRYDETSVRKEPVNGVLEQAEESNISTADVAGVSRLRSHEGDAQLRSLEGDSQLESHEGESQLRRHEKDVLISHEEGGQVNPSYSDSHEVVVASVSTRRDWSDVV